MPNLAILVAAFNPVDGGMECQFFSITESGLVADGTMPYDFNDNPSQFHAKLETAAKAVQTARHGVTFSANDKIQISAGRSS